MRKLTYYDEYHDAMKRLEQRSVLEGLGSILSSLEHDLKTPLALMGMIIHRTREKFQSNSEITTAMDKLEAERKRIGEVIRVVTYFQGGPEYFGRYMEKVNVLEILHRSIKSLKAAMDTSGIYFKVNGRDTCVKADSPMLEQAVVNILENAVESVRRAERRNGLVCVTVNPDPETRRQVRIEIVDNGCGLSAENLSEIRALLSVDNKVNNIKGLGLFVAKKLIGLHHGDLSINSEQGVGTHVLLTFPTWEESLSERVF